MAAQRNRAGEGVMKKLMSGILMLGWIPTLGVITGAKWIRGHDRKGHISRAVKGKDRIALDIGLADGATLPR